MPRIKEDDNILISYDISQKEKYWVEMSRHIKEKYGAGPFNTKAEVEPILMDVFNYFVNELQKLIFEEKSFNFFLYVFFLHEQSLQIHLKIGDGYVLKNINKDEFVTYRRILKIILEQGCEYNFISSKKVTGPEVLTFDEKLSKIIYVGRWAYHVADDIAFEKMIEDCHHIYFDKDHDLVLDWNYHYGHAYAEILPSMLPDYETGLVDDNSIKEFDLLLKESLKIDFLFSIMQINQIQKILSTGDTYLKTIEPYVLPKNLTALYGTEESIANLYYDGLILKKDNRLSINDIIYKPYSAKRYLFRPILVYNIDGVDRALVSENKFTESLHVIATNAIQWNTMPEEWLKNEALLDFMTKKGHEHDKILENEVEEITKKMKLPYDWNVKSLKREKQNNIVINEKPGEIDFLIVNPISKTVLVAEVKYNKARYEGVGYSADYSSFLKYEVKLKKKVGWITEHLKTVEYHLKEKNQLEELNLDNYKVQGIFIINTPTFYMFNGNYKAYTISKLEQFLKNTFDYPELIIDTDEHFMMIQHPYFRKPIMFD